MKVKQAIIHEIKKKEKETKGSHDVSNSVLMLDNRVVEMLAELDGRYISLSQSRGVFSSYKGLFPGTFQHFLTDRSEVGFVEFTHMATLQLVPHIEKEAPAKGGYLIFVEYEKGADFVAVFFVRHKTGGSIARDDSKKCYVINGSTYIDVDRLAMAARINVGEYEKGASGKRYISFINRKNVDSKYFTSWICTEQLRSDKEDTQFFKKILMSVPRPIDEDGTEIPTLEHLNRVYSYIKLIPKGERVDLKAIGEHFYGDPDILTGYADQNDIPINHDFRADATVLKQFVKIKVKADGIALDFPLSHIDDQTVKISGNRIIIESESLVNQILHEQRQRTNGNDITTTSSSPRG